jgi:hypothetical protein
VYHRRVRSPLAWPLGKAARLRFVRRRRAAPAVRDPRADELRRKLAESRSLVDEQEEFEGAETTVDMVEPLPEDPETRRRAVHEAARVTAQRMQS